jgi:hypothetical protein
MKSVESELLQYFDKDGKFVWAGTTDKIDSIDKLFKKEEKPADDASNS